MENDVFHLLQWESDEVTDQHVYTYRYTHIQKRDLFSSQLETFLLLTPLELTYTVQRRERENRGLIDSAKPTLFLSCFFLIQKKNQTLYVLCFHMSLLEVKVLFSVIYSPLVQYYAVMFFYATWVGGFMRSPLFTTRAEVSNGVICLIIIINFLFGQK